MGGLRSTCGGVGADCGRGLDTGGVGVGVCDGFLDVGGGIGGFLPIGGGGFDFRVAVSFDERLEEEEGLKPLLKVEMAGISGTFDCPGLGGGREGPGGLGAAMLGNFGAGEE